MAGDMSNLPKLSVHIIPVFLYYSKFVDKVCVTVCQYLQRLANMIYPARITVRRDLHVICRRNFFLVIVSLYTKIA